MRGRATTQRAVAKKKPPRATGPAADREKALAKARCTEIAMLAAARGWGKKHS